VTIDFSSAASIFLLKENQQEFLQFPQSAIPLLKGL